MSSKNDRSKTSLKSRLLARLMKMGVPIILALHIAFGATQSDSFAAKPLARKAARVTAPESDDDTFSPTAKISASVGKGGKNEKQDVLLVKRLLSKFGYKLVLNGEADAALISAIGDFQATYMPNSKSDERIDPEGDAVRGEYRTMVQAAMSALPAKQREVL